MTMEAAATHTPPRDRERFERCLPGEAERCWERELDRKRECGDCDLLRRYGGEKTRKGETDREKSSV
jgi:hypothetical protein